MTDTPEAVRLADQIHAGNGEWMQKAAALLRRIPGLEADYQRLMDKHNALHINALASRQRVAELESEVQEQARLNGMGAERELALMAQVSRLEAERDQLREAIKKQSNAVTLFQKVASENARHFADANLRREADLSTAEAKSVAEANAILTAENDQLRAELARFVEDNRAQGAGEVVAWQASDGGSSYISNEARSRNSAFRELYTIPLYTQPAAGADVPDMVEIMALADSYRNATCQEATASAREWLRAAIAAIGRKS